MKASDLVTNYRNAVKKLVDGLDEARTWRGVYDSLGGASFLEKEGSFLGVNTDINAQKVADAMNAVAAITSAGHPINLNRLRA